MSKIYEALQNAEKARRRSSLPDMLSPKFPEKKGLRVVRGIETEKRKVGRYQNVEFLLPSVEALLPKIDKKVIQFVGSRRGEGTSTVVRQFAGISVLKMQKSVLVLDADGINPVQHDLFDVRPEHCLDEVITEGDPIEEACCRVGDLQLSICRVSGNSAPPSRVLSGSGIWERLRTGFDLVVIDSPPLEASSDGLALAGKADGVVLVVEAENTRWPVVENLKDSIIGYGGNILGVVLNKRRFHVPGWLYKRL